jgi:hypothetical protein
MEKIDAVKITVERGEKKAIACCDTGMFVGGKCKEARCPLNICCVVCSQVFVCPAMCNRIDLGLEVRSDES